MTRRVLLVFGLVSVLLLGVINLVYAQDSGPQNLAGPQSVDTPQVALGTAFTQGQLKSGGTAVNGSCEMAFRLYDAASVGSLIGSPLTQTVMVNAGLFTTQLDFGASAFNGQGRWLETAVKCGSDVAFTTLSRQALTVTPYAAYAQSVGAHDHWGGSWNGTGTGLTLTSTNKIGVVGATNSSNSYGVSGWHASVSGAGSGVWGQSTSTDGRGVTGSNTAASGQNYGVYGEAASTSGRGVAGFATATTGSAYGIFGQVASPNGWAGYFTTNVGNGLYINAPAGTGLNVVSGTALVAGNPIWHAGNDGSGSGLDADKLDGLHSQNYWQLGGNAVATDTVLGTTSNYALNINVNNQRALRLEPNGISPNVIGGYSGNSVAAYGATIGGGGESGYPNQVTGYFGTVGGGDGNTAGGSSSTVGGGTSNYATNSNSTVGGGLRNEAGGQYATVGGGYDNTASGEESTISGGRLNTASGYRATVIGGSSNYAKGEASTVIGGIGASARRHGELAFGGGSAQGQSSWFVLSQKTSGTVSETLYLDGDVIAGEVITFSGETSAVFEIMVVGRGLTKSGGYLIQGLIENWQGTTTVIGTPNITVLGENDPTWNVGVLADNTLDGLIIWVQGSTGDTINWSASVHTIERNQP